MSNDGDQECNQVCNLVKLTEQPSEVSTVDRQDHLLASPILATSSEPTLALSPQEQVEPRPRLKTIPRIAPAKAKSKKDPFLQEMITGIQKAQDEGELEALCVIYKQRGDIITGYGWSDLYELYFMIQQAAAELQEEDFDG